jgi:hypothetical protein
MRLYIQIPAIILFGYIFELFLPWYSIAFVAFAFGYILDSESNFIGGFLGIAFLWALMIFFITNNAAVDLTAKVAEIMAVGEKWIVILVTLALGGLVGGFACVSGASAKMRRKEGYY